MVFWKSQNVVKYSPEDVEVIINEEIDRIGHFLGDQVYITSSGTGVVSEKQLSLDLENKLLSTGRTSIGLLSLELDISREILDGIIKRPTSFSTEFYIDSNGNVFTRGELKRLEEALLTQMANSTTVSALDFCAKHNLHLNALRWIVDKRLPEDTVVINESIVISSTQLAKYSQLMADRLNSLSEPTAVMTTFKGSDIIPELLQPVFLSPKWIREQQSINGMLTQEGIFIPKTYTENKRKGCVEKLKQQGFIQISELSSVGIKKPQNYLESNLARELHLYFLTEYVITENFISETLEHIKTDLKTVGFCDLSSTPLASINVADDQANIYKKHLATNLHSHLKSVPHKPFTTMNKSLLLTEWYLEKAVTNFTTYYKNLAESQAEELVQDKLKLAQIEIEGSMDSPEVDNLILDKSGAKTNIVLKNGVQALKTTLKEEALLVPPPPDSFTADVLGLFSHRVITEYKTTLIDAVKNKLAYRHRQDLLKLYCYLQGIVDLHPQDTKLASKLLAELKVYGNKNFHWKAKNLLISEKQGDKNEDPQKLLEATFSELSTPPDPSAPSTNNYTLEHDMNTTKQMLQNNLLRQVSIASDPALVLHLSVIIVHSRTLSTAGILHASGKHVPKILKVLNSDSPANNSESQSLLEVFTSLKDAIVNHASLETQSRLALTVKAHLSGT